MNIAVAVPPFAATNRLDGLPSTFGCSLRCATPAKEGA